MEFGDGIDQAHAYATKALEVMREHSIPPTPNNFTVWYAYVGETFPDLNKALNILISNNQPFDAVQNAAIYDKYFTTTDEGLAVHETGRQIEDQMGKLLEVLGVATEGVDNYEEKLKVGLGSIAESKGLGGIKDAMERLVAQTQHMQKSNQKLQAKLEDSSSEIATLRQNLEEVQIEAMTDALTGIANRKMFDAALRRATSESMETGEPMCLALADIDYFKKFNDTYGHQTGDQVLKLVARIMKDNVKGRDVAARYGGEEFGVILPQTAIDDAKIVCEQIRNGVATKRIRNRQTGEEMGNITLSLGVALFKPGEPLSELIHRADEGLYHAKNSGRNQTVLEDELDTIEAR